MARLDTRITAELMKRVRVAAARDGLTIAQMVQYLLDRGLGSEETKD